MLRLASTSTARLPSIAPRFPFHRFTAFHSSSLYSQLDTSSQSSTSSTSSDPIHLTPAARRRLQPSPTFSSSPSSSSEPVPQPISPPPSSVQLKKRQITSVNELPKSFGRNQIIEVPDEVRRDLEDVLTAFKAPVRFAFAYGSGVFRQKGYTTEVKFHSLSIYSSKRELIGTGRSSSG